MWVKMCVKMCVSVFKMLKRLLKIGYQTDPLLFLLFDVAQGYINLIEILKDCDIKDKRMVYLKLA